MRHHKRPKLLHGPLLTFNHPVRMSESWVEQFDPDCIEGDIIGLQVLHNRVRIGTVIGVSFSHEDIDITVHIDKWARRWPAIPWGKIRTLRRPFGFGFLPLEGEQDMSTEVITWTQIRLLHVQLNTE